MLFDEKPKLKFLKPEPVRVKRSFHFSRRLKAGIVGVLLLVGIVFCISSCSKGIGGHNLPDFTSYSDVTAKKEAFFSFLYPLIVENNKEILEIRNDVLEIQADFARKGELSSSEKKFLRKIGERYEFEDLDVLDERFITYLLKRVDVVPPSLAMAQAAYESGWGTSRFARKGNNLYGIWCYTPGCGLVPSRRNPGDKHEVTRYDSVEKCISAYMFTLNTSKSYFAARAIRADYRNNGNEPSGIAMAQGLENYSGIGWDYVLEIQDVIRVNDLSKYDDMWLSEI
jgi:Bax protein